MTGAFMPRPSSHQQVFLHLEQGLCVCSQDFTLPSLWILTSSLTLDVEMELKSEDLSCCLPNMALGKLPCEGTWGGHSFSFSFSAATVLIFRVNLTGGQGQSVPCDPNQKDCWAAVWLILVIWRDRQMLGARCWAMEINQEKSGTSNRGTSEALGKGHSCVFSISSPRKGLGKESRAGASKGRWPSVAELLLPQAPSHLPPALRVFSWPI